MKVKVIIGLVIWRLLVKDFSGMGLEWMGYRGSGKNIDSFQISLVQKEI